MRIYKLLFLLLLFPTGIFAQDTLMIYQSNGVITKFATCTIDSLVFYDSINFKRCGTVSDYDGNTYECIQIANQCWMAENLRTRHFSDGRQIPHITDNISWDNMCRTTAILTWWDDDSTYANPYGAFYSWGAILDGVTSGSNNNPSGIQGVCPAGWHVPSKAEWDAVDNYIDSIGHGNYDDKILRKNGAWTLSPLAYDLWGFSAIPTGYRGNSQYSYPYCFSSQNHVTRFWSTSKDGSTQTWVFNIFADSYDQYQSLYSRSNKAGFSVRCVKD